MKNGLVTLVLVALWAGCSPNNVKVEEDLKQYFEENRVQGTFGIYNNGSGDFTIYNLSRFKDSAYLPASTFKIVNGLIGLETGRIDNEKMVIEWDGVQRDITSWNKDLTMEEAFKASSVPYFQEVARRIGKDTMQHWLDTLGYGERYGKSLISKVDTFWLDNSIKVTADEQLGLVKKLYFDQLPFQKRSQRIIKDVMVQEKNANYTLAYKTGLGYTEKGNKLGWIVGWVVENNHPYFFVLNVESTPDKDLAPIRLGLLKKILTHLGFLEGRM